MQEYLVAGVLLIFLILLIQSLGIDCSGPMSTSESNLADGKLNYLARTADSDSAFDCVNRLEWLADQKEEIWKDAAIVAIISVLLLFVILESLRDVWSMLILLLIIFLAALSLFGFKKFHLYNINTYLVKKNLHKVRSHLGSKQESPKKPSKDIPSNCDIFSLII